VLLNHIRVVAVVGYTFDPQADHNGPLVVTIAGCLYFAGLLYEFFSKKPYSMLAKSEHYSVALVLNVIFFVFMVIDKYITLTSTRQSVTFLLVLFPVIIKLSLDFLHQLNDRVLY